MTSQRHSDYAATLVDDQDGPLTAAQAAYQAAQPLPIAQQLLDLAEFSHLAQKRPDVVTADGALRYVRDELLAMAGRQR